MHITNEISDNKYTLYWYKMCPFLMSQITETLLGVFEVICWFIWRKVCLPCLSFALQVKPYTECKHLKVVHNTSWVYNVGF